MNDIHYITPEGKRKLETELKELTEKGRKELSERLKHAISMGDLSENADYHKAKEDQGFLEGRIQEIEAILRNAEIIESRETYQHVALGATFTIREDGYEPETYLMVGKQEADPQNGKISDESPIGKALLGHQVGDIVQVELPSGGNIQLEIIAIA